MKLKKVDKQKVMALYNASGGKVARSFTKSEYDIVNPSSVIGRLKQDPANGYDEIKDKFNYMTEQTPFLDLDELCSGSKKSPIVSAVKRTCNETGDDDRSLDFAINRIHWELAMEKLLEMTKYISLNYATGKCRIDKRSLISAGYQVEIY